MNENTVLSEHQVIDCSSASDLLHAPKQKFQLGAQPSSLFPPSSDPNHCGLLAEAINCPLPIAVDAVLETSQSGIGSENQTGDICLGSESFLQSLESIPLPPLVRNEAPLYNPMTTYSDLYTHPSEATHLSCSSAAVQQELLQAWGSTGPPSMDLNTSPGADFVRAPFVPSESPVVRSRCIPRAVRSRGRGRGPQRKFSASSNSQSRNGPAPQNSFSPCCAPPMCPAGLRSETMTTSALSYLPMVSNQLPPPQNRAHSSLSRDAVLPVRQTCNRKSTETVMSSEENQANEKMDAYIEKFSGESCELFGSSVAVDVSRKPSTLQEAISMYIDFIVLENEKRTRISCCNILPMPLDFHKEDYYHEIMCQPIAFPTPKFRDWLRLYNVDIEITDPDGQTVSQTTFPPSANFSDTRVSIPTSLHMINWQCQARGIPVQPAVLSTPRFNVPAVFRGRPKTRPHTGHALRLGHSDFNGIAGHPFEFVQNRAADGAANVQFLRGNAANSMNGPPASPCSGVMNQFQTISLPALGSIQYLGQAPTSVNIPRPCPEVSSNDPLQMISSSQHGASTNSSSYYRMAPVFSPSSKDMAWKSCFSRPDVLVSDLKTTGFTEMEAENMAAYLNKLETATSSDNTMSSVPPVVNMLPPFSSFVNGASANLPPCETEKSFAPVQSSVGRSKSCQFGEAVVCDNFQSLTFAREQECTNVSLLPPATKNDGLSLAESRATTRDSRLNWNDGKLYTRPGGGPVFKEMVDQGSQTELEKVTTEDRKANNSGTAIQEGQTTERGFQLDAASICSFSCNDDFDESGKTEDQLNSEILLRNASIILNGSLEVDQSIQATSFASQELLNSSQASTLGDMDGLALSGVDCRGIHSFMTVSLSCTSEEPEKVSSSERRSSGDCCSKADGKYDETAAESDGLTKASDLLLEVGSNVEINTEGEPTVGEGSNEQWLEPKRKRARLSRVGNRQVVGGQDQWSNRCMKSQRKQTTDPSAADATAFELGTESVNDDNL